MCLTRMEELESCLSGLLSTLKKNREHVPLEVLKTQYKQPYEELVRNINLTASAYAKSVLLHRLVLNPDADVEEQCTVINQMIQTSGMLKKISSCMSKTYDVGQIYPLILELRHATFITSFYQYTTKKTINKQQEKHFEPPIAGRLLLCPKAITNTTYRFYVVRCFRIFFYFLSQVLNQTVNSVIHF